MDLKIDEIEKGSHMSCTVQAINADGDICFEYGPATKEEAYYLADQLAEIWCQGWRPGGRVIVLENNKEVRCTMMGDDPFENLEGDFER